MKCPYCESELEIDANSCIDYGGHEWQQVHIACIAINCWWGFSLWERVDKRLEWARVENLLERWGLDFFNEHHYRDMGYELLDTKFLGINHNESL